MRYYQHIIIVVVFMQLLVLCSARTPFVSVSRPISSSYWNEIGELDANANNNNYEPVERATTSFLKRKSSNHPGTHISYEERRKKFLGEPTNLQGGRSLQGLWAMPGRR